MHSGGQSAEHNKQNAMNVRFCNSLRKEVTDLRPAK